MSALSPFMVGREPAAGPSGHRGRSAHPVQSPPARKAGVSRGQSAAVAAVRATEPGAAVASLPGCRPRTGGRGMEGRVLLLVPGQGLEQARRSLVDEAAVTGRSLWDSARRGAPHSSRRSWVQTRCPPVGLCGVGAAERTSHRAVSARPTSGLLPSVTGAGRVCVSPGPA